jgi:predicted extracellular nuclease
VARNTPSKTLHLAVLGLLATAPAPAPAQTLATIMEIQGPGDLSPLEGELVETTGIVTLLTRSGFSFWIQDPTGDGDDATSDGLFVFGGGPRPAVPVEIGDEVRARGRVREFRPSSRASDRTVTELRFPSRVEILSRGNDLPPPVPLGDLPDESVPEAIDFWEPLEGMRVEVAGARVVAPTTRFGEFAMLAQGNARPGSGFFPSGKRILLRPLGGDAVDYNPERVLVDDASLVRAPRVRPGDRIPYLAGVVDYTFGAYKLQPHEIEVRTHPLPRSPVSRRARNSGWRSPAQARAVITTFNVENLFDLVNDPGHIDIGVGGPEDEAELEVRLTKLASAIELELRLPDILVVQEVEKTALLQELGDRVNERTGTAYLATSFDTSDPRGIEVGFLHDEARVEMLEAFPLSGPDVEAAFGRSGPSPGREPLVGRFRIGHEEITIIGLHLRSKRGDDPVFGSDQPPLRRSEATRKAQARVVRGFVDRILDADPGARVLVTGDMNDLEFPEPGEGPDHPVAILEGVDGGPPLFDVIALERAAERFSFIFDGNGQALDHTLVSPALLERLVGADFLHFNAPFPAWLETDASTPLRASDHDPLETRFVFAR